LIESRNDDGDKWSKVGEFQDNEVVFTGFGPWSLRKNLDLKPKGSCKGFIMKQMKNAKEK